MSVNDPASPAQPETASPATAGRPAEGDGPSRAAGAPSRTDARRAAGRRDGRWAWSFIPPGVEFRGVSPHEVKVSQIGNAISAVITLGIALAVSILWWKWAWIAVAVLAVIHIWLFWRTPRYLHSIGYGGDETTFYYREGLMFRSLTAVPYGRIQYVEISEGPIARHFGLSSVEIHTASAETDVSIDGLDSGVAAELRSTLMERADAEMMGL